MSTATLMTDIYLISNGSQKSMQLYSVADLSEWKHLIWSMFIPQHLKDKFWNFIFYKFIFIFGVLNVQTVEEVVMWCLWFSALVFLHLMVQLCKDRFEYVSIIK